ncbi:uncharacterized protein LOC115767069 isoform X2 [Drosophila novamexicana]|uniref:uncharacterized protein LOC115767069 isoform X2 n=1 Tax=Drosophila novamexicana TaxID=47314 RepID=UPI0011E5F11D|nr:uncharacterized protein LOC115767069 isoform X2 [Drosophila novamexicana]
MYIAGTSQMSTFIWLLVIIAVAGSVDWPSRQGDPCTWALNYPKSHCRLAQNCQTLPVYINENLLKLADIPSCGFIDASHSEMFCCPDAMPGPMVSSLTLAGPTVQNSFNHLASLGYYKADTLDEIVYRCTAIILSPTQLLATSKCVGNKIFEKPNRVLVGVTDPRKFFDPELEFELTTKVQYKNDLALFSLASSIDVNKTELANLSLASLCNETELEGDPKLYAVGFAQDNGSNCGLFKTRLERFNDCTKVDLKRQVSGIDKSRNLCLVPQPNASLPGVRDDCTKCLTASTSVLHVERADGSFCVAAIATPTTNDCIVNSGPIYYTSIVGKDVGNFRITANNGNCGNLCPSSGEGISIQTKVFSFQDFIR